MRRFIIPALLMLPVAAMAEQTQYTPTATVLLDQALRCESVASAQIAALQKQVADLTIERDALKKAAAKTPTVDLTPSGTKPK